MATSIRCRGLRKWCNRRCDVTMSAAPSGYPTVGFYCALHKYQEPRVGMDGTIRFESTAVEEHVRRRTSFVAPESSVALDMIKAPGLVRDRADYPRTVAGADVASWLRERRGLDDDGAIAYAQRMVDLEMLLPATKAYKRFSVDRNALYRIQVPVAGSAVAGAGAR